VALLVYDDVSAISYVAADIAVLLSPEQQSLCIQALSLFEQPSAWFDWETNRALIDELVASSLLALETPVPITPLWGFSRQRVFADEFSVIAGNAQNWTSDVNQRFGGYFRQNTPAQYDELQLHLKLPPGTYSFALRHIKNTLYGIADLTVDGTYRGSIDMYNATLVYNQLYTLGSIPMTGDAEHDIRFKINSKNALSTNYFFLWSYVDIIRTGD